MVISWTGLRFLNSLLAITINPLFPLILPIQRERTEKAGAGRLLIGMSEMQFITIWKEAGTQDGPRGEIRLDGIR